MAARNFTEGPRVLQRGDVVEVFGVFTGKGGAAGAMTKVAGHGITSCTAGADPYNVFTVVLSDKYANLIGASATVVDPTPAAQQVVVVTSYDMSTKTVVFTSVDVGGTAQPIPTDGQLMFRLTLVNSSQPIK